MRKHANIVGCHLVRIALHITLLAMDLLCDQLQSQLVLKYVIFDGRIQTYHSLRMCFFFLRCDFTLPMPFEIAPKKR